MRTGAATKSPLHLVALAPTKETEASGVVPVRGPRRSISLAEEAAVREAALFDRIDFVFFRRFADARSPQIAAYVVDNEDGKLTEKQLADLHWHVWMQGAAPLLYISWPNRLDVLACARAPDFWRENSQERKYPKADDMALSVLIETASEVNHALLRAQEFSAHRLSDGTFWEDPSNNALMVVEEASHHQLIGAIVDTDVAISGSTNPVLRRLLLLTLLVKYLEDRTVFPGPAWFGRFCRGARCFHDLLRQGTLKEVTGFFTFLENRFNGDVFSFPDRGLQGLSAAALREFADLVEARTLKRQRYLWEQFSFRHLPVEVLSHLYQRFAQRELGAVFTPPFVASLLLDYALPYAAMTGRERVLDPTCGSGVFLVGAFRRLVHYWRSRHGWRQPEVEFLKRMLREQIHGIELQAEALDLAAFNLALALCDALRPDIIWRELKFDRLRGNSLLEGDFFQHVQNCKGEFDLVIGNPPFQSNLTPAALEYDRETAERVRVPDKQIAYLVAERSMALLGKTGRICLLEPSGLVYNEKTIPYLRRFICATRVERVLDFTSIRSLFDEADTKVIALIASNTANAGPHAIEHLTFRRTFIVDQRLGFELDHYDRHLTSQDAAIATPEIWKINLLGGGRLHFVAARLAEMGTLREFVDEKKWEYGEGFIAAESGKRDPAPWLHHQRLLPSTALTENGIDATQLEKVKDTHFRSAYTPARYASPLFLIRENERLHCGFWDDDGLLAYKAQIVGIHTPERGALKRFSDTFTQNRRELSAFCLLRGTRALASKATAINKTDIDRLPWPRAGESWELSDWERILCADLVDYVAEFVRKGQNSQLLREAASPLHFEAYATTFVSTLRLVHPELRAGGAIAFDGLACQIFYFGDRPEVDWPTDWTQHLRQLVYAPKSAALRTVRVLRFYQGNVIVIVKPERLRYWIRSIAIRDADETLHDLRQQGF